MAKPTHRFFCADCGAEYSKWQGQCDGCRSWNRISEVAQSRLTGGYAGAAGGTAELVTLDQISVSEAVRIGTGIGELDRVLGGGLVPGSAIVLGGHPGAGKSTLVLQALGNLARQHPVLYVTGEESLQQVAMRAQRLGVAGDQLKLLAETRVEAVIDCCLRHRPRVLVIDSIQVMQLAELQSAPGSVGQVRESAARLTRFAKESDTILLLVGHVTKEGHLAGPKVLEH
ncbi:MAG: AAA family ATPase, partial [Pseudomonadales bacterium]|nr:AAA family ATPase [Pseudomonadales bacterium]